MKKRSYEDWIDLHWQRELTQEEAQHWQSFLSNQPEFAAQWHLDQQLLLGVRSLNDIPLSNNCLLYTSPSPRDRTRSRMPSSA